MTVSYLPHVSHNYRFKRGDRVRIRWGRYAGAVGVVDSAVFQKTVDFQTIFILATTWFWTTSELGHGLLPSLALPRIRSGELLRSGGTGYQAFKITGCSG